MFCGQSPQCCFSALLCILSMIRNFVRAYLKAHHIFVKLCFRLQGEGGAALGIKEMKHGITFMTWKSNCSPHHKSLSPPLPKITKKSGHTLRAC